MLKYLFILLALIYLFLPYDLVPDFLAGWGWLDDVAVLALLWRFYHRLKKKQQPARPENDRFERAGRNGRRPEDPRRATAADDPYSVLGVDRDASAEDIKRAYRRLAGQYHPDKVAHLGDEFRELAERRFKEIQQAYQAVMKTRSG
jgi:uncharacterized membrane protein YkvA (DUF1232 family)